jgi:small-conductance mechanosensitive channel
MPESFDQLIALLDRIFHYTLFEVNQTPVTVASLALFTVVLALLFVGSRLVERVILRRVFMRVGIETGLQFTLGRIFHYVVMTVGTIIAVQFVGLDLGALAVIFGLLSVGVGFGLQNVTSNFVAGLILLFERPIVVGDRVTVGGTEGDVISINMRSSTIRSMQNIAIIVPNSDFISSQVVNWSHGDRKIRLDVEVGVSYGSDLELVLATLKDVALSHPAVLKEPTPDVLLQGFGDSAWNMQLRAWIPDPNKHHIVRSELNCEIVRAFRAKGIEIPFPQRDLHVRSPLPVPVSSGKDA